MAHQRLFVVSNKRTFGLTESEVLSIVHRGLKAMINFENRFAAKTKSEDFTKENSATIEEIEEEIENVEND